MSKTPDANQAETAAMTEHRPPVISTSARWRAYGAAEAVLDLRDIAAAAGVSLVADKHRGGLDVKAGMRVFSPFRDDGKSPALLLTGDCDNGRSGRVIGTKDMSTGETMGIWMFGAACFGLDLQTHKEQIRDRLIEISGVTVEPASRGDGRASRSLKRATVARKLKAAALERQQARRHRVMDNDADVDLAALESWPECVARKWREGRTTVGQRAGDDEASPSSGMTKNELWDYVEALANARGWPLDWVRALWRLGLISWPLLAWRESGRSGKGSPRGVAFKVELRIGTLEGGEPSTYSAHRNPHSAIAIGYHQRFWTNEGKKWMYLPYWPPRVGRDGKAKRLSTYQRELAAHERVIPALPFVIGDLDAPLWIITEGQWDAVTLFGALGGFEGLKLGFRCPPSNHEPPNLQTFELSTLCAFGLRGAAGDALFFKAYGELMTARKPRVLVMADNDSAASRWEARLDDHGGIEYGVFDRIVRAVGRERCVLKRPVAASDSVAQSNSAGQSGGGEGKPIKDFNDWWIAQAEKPGTDDMWAMVEAWFVIAEGKAKPG